MTKTFTLCILQMFLVFQLFSQADAGSDQNICTNHTILQAVDPSPNTGLWTVISGSGTFFDPTLYNTSVTNIAKGTNVYRWEVTIGMDNYADNVIINNNSPHVLFSPSTHLKRFPDAIFGFENLSDQSLNTYLWEFGDGTNNFQPGYVGYLDHSYTTWGTFGIALTGSNGICDAIYRDTIVILPPCPFSSDEQSLIAEGCEDLTVDFEANIQFADSIEWRFYGDFMYPDSISNEINPNFTYYEAGEYYPVVRAWAEGCYNTYKRKDTVIVYKVPDVDFDAAPRVLENDTDPVRFYNYSDYETDYSYLWDFGDNTTSAETEPLKLHYEDPGFYDISLTVTTPYNCTNSLTKEDFIEVIETEQYISLEFDPWLNAIIMRSKYEIDDLSANIYDLNGTPINFQLYEYNKLLRILFFKTKNQGIYILRVATQDDVQTLKILKLW